MLPQRDPDVEALLAYVREQLILNNASEIQKILEFCLQKRVSASLSLLCRDSSPHHALVMMVVPKHLLERYLLGISESSSGVGDLGRSTEGGAEAAAFKTLAGAASLLEHPMLVRVAIASEVLAEVKQVITAVMGLRNGR